MSGDERLRREREFFDSSSAAQAGTEAAPPTHHVAMLLDRLGDARGARALDCGCGAGDLALEIARGGAEVHGFDLSPESLRLMRERARALGVNVPAFVSVMERVPFGDGTFDVVVGKSILHHVDVLDAMREVHRVLRPGGRALFIENQVTNPLLRFAREKLTGRFGVARLGTIDEHPLVARDYAGIRRVFGDATLLYPDFRFFSLFSRNVLRYKRARWLMRLLERLDEFVYKRVPALRKYGYHVIIDVTKR
jgi:SAM-dependent methyltransferase